MPPFIVETATFIVDFSLVAWKELVSPLMLLVYAMAGLFLLLDAHRRGWEKCFTNKMVSGLGATAGVMLLNALFVPLLLIWFDTIAATYESLGIPHIAQETWVGVPFLIMVVIALVTTDFVDYLAHRAMHTKWLWPLHALHHSDHEVNGLTTFRVHILEVVFVKGSFVILLTWLGIPAEVSATAAVAHMFHNVYVHARVDWTHGPFKLLIASPRFHLWHHADVPEAHGKNIANLIPLWDVLGGTYYEGGPCTAPTGAKGVAHDDVVSLMTYPFFQWGRNIKGLKMFKQRKTQKNLNAR